MKKEDVWRLESCEMWLWRKVLNISWSDKVCNEEVLKRVGEERAVIYVTNRRQRALSIQPKIPEISGWYIKMEWTISVWSNWNVQDQL